MLKNFQKTLLFAGLILSVALAAGCGGSNGSSGTNQVAGKTDKNTLVVATSGDARSVDPHAAGDSLSVNGLMPVVETLVKIGDKGDTEPHLAEKWERVDGKTWKFFLRKGVQFHNGEEMKASDVVFSFKRALSDKGTRVQYIMGMVDPEGFEILDDYTVLIRTKIEFSPFIDYMPYVGAAIISEKAYSDPGAELHPIGTGPFTFVEWKKGSQLTYKRNDNYWGEKPSYENLIIKAIPEANSRLIELETGKADIAISMTANDINKIKDNPKLTLVETPTTIFTQLGFHHPKAPFNNPKFREALDWAIDQEGVVKAVHKGAARFTPGPVTPDQKYFDDSEVKDRYDVEKAKALLKESGVDLSKTLTITTNDSQPRIDLATIVQSQLKEVGINVEIKVMESASYLDFIGTDQKDMFIIGWGAVGFKDPDNNIYGPAHSSMIPDNNSFYYSNKELDRLLDQSRILSDGPQREKTIKDIQKLIRNDIPYLTFDNPMNIIGTQAYIEGFHALPTAHQFYNRVIIK